MLFQRRDWPPGRRRTRRLPACWVCAKVDLVALSHADPRSAAASLPFACIAVRQNKSFTRVEQTPKQNRYYSGAAPGGVTRLCRKAHDLRGGVADYK
jgi:hypothetical protein